MPLEVKYVLLSLPDLRLRFETPQLGIRKLIHSKNFKWDTCQLLLDREE